jgi:hypothetical protein
MKIVQLNESYLIDLIKKRIQEQSDLSERGHKGLWKSEWNEEDQMLAMYNSLYGIEDLGFNKKEVAEDIIGSSLDSLNQQTSNFDFLSGKNGYSRAHSVQSPVYEKFKDMPKPEFKLICLEIIHKRLENPEEAAVNKKLGQEIGSKRDSIAKEREDAFKQKGIDPNKRKLTMIGSRPKNQPVEDDPESEPEMVKEKPTEKEHIRNFLKSIQDRLKNINSKEDAIALSGDLELAIEYIDNELTDIGNENMVAEITNLIKNKNIITESKVVKEFKRITEIMRNL